MDRYTTDLEKAMGCPKPEEEAIVKAHGRMRVELTFETPYRPVFWQGGQKQATAIMMSGFVHGFGIKRVSVVFQVQCNWCKGLGFRV
jgi:hypothetical protein